MDLGTRALAFAGDIEHHQDISEVAASLDVAIALVGMTASACGMVTGPKGLSRDPFHFVNWPADWVEHYERNGFLKIDPIPRWAIVSGAPVSWSDVIKALPTSDPGWTVVRAAKARGLTEGYVTPVRSFDGSLGLVSVGGGRGLLRSEEKAFLQLVSTAALHRAQALSSVSSPAPNSLFSFRERECISLLAQGFTDREMARILGIAALTVRSHLGNARLRVGARTRTQLVAIATSAMAAAE